MAPGRSPLHPPEEEPALSRPTIALSALALAATLALSACGGSGGDAQDGTAGAGSSNGQRRGGAFAALQDPKVQACLKKQGVTVPTAPPGDGQGRTPYGGQGQGQGPPPDGGGEGGQRRGGMFSDDLRAALAKCGVQLPQPGQGGRPPTGTSTTATTTA
jgi:hypothetical protein